MKLEISTNHWLRPPRGPIPAERAVEKAVKLGFKHIQIGTPHTQANLEKLKQLKEAHSLTYSVHMPFLAEKDFIASPSYKDPKSLERSRKIYLKSLDNAHEIDAEKLIVHSSELGRHEGIPQLVESLDMLCRKAYAYDQIICLENKSPESEIGFTEEDIQGIYNEVDQPNLKLCFDTAHAIISRGSVTGMLSFLEDVATEIGDVHLVPATPHKDLHYAPDEHIGFVEDVIKILKDAGYTGDLTFEAVYDTDEHIVKGMKYVQSLLGTHES